MSIRILVLIWSAILGFSDVWAQDRLPFMVGGAQSVITPMDTAFIAGHSHNRIFQGVNDNIYVKAGVISNRYDTIVIMTFDCIGLLHPELEQIRNRLKQRYPKFPTENIVMSSTHTHSGPDVVGIWGKNVMHSGVDPEYMEMLLDRSVNTILKAWDKRQPAYAEYCMTEHGHEWVYNISEPSELDRSVTALRFQNDQGENVLTMTNFACHPTFLDAVNDQVSSDYVGGYYERMDQEQGGLNMFLQGSIGGWIQPEYEEKTAKQAFFRGRVLAIHTLHSLSSSTRLEEDGIFMLSKKFYLPVENPGFVQLSKLGVIQRDFQDSVQTEVAVFSIGEASFATHPGETVPELSHRTKALMETSGPKFIMGLGMDALGYILKPYFFDAERSVPHSPYLCSVSVGPKTQEMIFDVLKELITGKQE